MFFKWCAYQFWNVISLEIRLLIRTLLVRLTFFFLLFQICPWSTIPQIIPGPAPSSSASHRLTVSAWHFSFIIHYNQFFFRIVSKTVAGVAIVGPNHLWGLLVSVLKTCKVLARAVLHASGAMIVSGTCRACLDELMEREARWSCFLCYCGGFFDPRNLHKHMNLLWLGQDWVCTKH